MSNDPSVFLAEMEMASVSANDMALRTPLWMPGGQAIGSGEGEEVAYSVQTTPLFFSDKGWIGEPSDPLRPNRKYLARLMAPPSFERRMPIYPEADARSTVQVGELVLDNSDGLLDQLAGDWSLAGRPVRIYRGDHTRPYAASFSSFLLVANLLAASAGQGTKRVTVQLMAKAPDLTMPVCEQYTGQGGLNGEPANTGMNRPLLLGVKNAISPVQIHAGKLIYQISGSRLSYIGNPTFQGTPVALMSGVSDFPNFTDLSTAVMPANQSVYATCKAEGLIRFSFTPTGRVLVDAATAFSSARDCLNQLLQLRTGIVLSDFVEPGSHTGGFWNFGVGVYLRDGSIEDAVNAIVKSVGGYWGINNNGKFDARYLPLPETSAANFTVEEWMIDGEVTEAQGMVPRWQQCVYYGLKDTVLTNTDLAGSVLVDQNRAASFTIPKQPAYSSQLLVKQAYPTSGSFAFDTLLVNASQATLLADYLMSCFGRRRRIWDIPVGKYGHQLTLGQTIRVNHPSMVSRNWIVVAKSETGDDISIAVWG